jgi:serine phosphatase RsbU (regulator of sigma subunit)
VVHRPADETLAWAIAGHPPPLRLDDGAPLDDWGAGQPLGLEVELAVASRVEPFGANSGVLLYTEGILDARDDAAERFGEERLQALVASHGRETAPAWWSTCGRRWRPTRRRRATTCVCSRRATARG